MPFSTQRGCREQSLSVVGASVGTRVGAGVGACVGNCVGASVGASVGANVGRSVGAAHVPSTVHTPLTQSRGPSTQA